MLRRRITLALQIADGGKAPTEIRLFASGWNDTLKGLFLCDQVGVEQAMRAFNDANNRLTFYFEHPELDGRPPEERKSAGSFVLEARAVDGGFELWAVDIQWAAGVAEAIEAKQWLFYSPGFWYDGETRRILEVINCALTNEPATKGARPLLMAASRMEALGMSHEQIRAALQTLIGGVAPESETEWNYIRDVFDDSVVFERAGKLWQVRYAMDAAGAPTLLGGPVEVVIAYQPVPQQQTLGAVSYKAGPIDDTAGWNAKAAEKSVRDWATKPDGSIDWAKYRRAFAWVDEANAESVSGCKLIHHEMQQGELTVSRAGCLAAAAACMGARGGVDLPEADMDAVKAHLGQHYKAMGMVAPWDRDQQQSSSRAAGANGRASAKETSLMDKAFLSALGLPETAQDTEALAKLTEVRAHQVELGKLTGKDNPAEALGVVASWKEAADKLPAVQAELANVHKTNERAGIVALLDKAAAEHRLTPDEHKTYLADYDSGALSAAWLSGRVPSKPVNQVLSGAGTGAGKPDAQVSSEANPAPAGKTWEQLSAMEKHELYVSNRQAYAALKAEHAKSQGK